MIDRDAAQRADDTRAARRGASRIDRVLAEIDALVDADEAADRSISGAWRTFADILAAEQAHAWDAYSIDLLPDAASYRSLDRSQRRALQRVFATIYRAESVVDDWMDRIVAAIPVEDEDEDASTGYQALRAVLKGQEHDERMHRGSLLRVAKEVFGVEAEDVERLARRSNNFVAEMLFARFEEEMAHLLRPNRPLADVFTAIFIYGILSEDVVANSDVAIRRANHNDKYAEFGLPGMREGQTNVRRDEGRHVRIAVLASRKFLDEHEGAAERLVAVSTEYMDLADRLLVLAKRSYGVIDAHLRESYGPDVDALYYYLVNMKRLAVRLDELGLLEAVRDIRRRVERAVGEFADDRRRPIIDEPTPLARRFGPTVLRVVRKVRH